jgi:hypothetical protein
MVCECQRKNAAASLKSKLENLGARDYGDANHIVMCDQEQEPKLAARLFINGVTGGRIRMHIFKPISDNEDPDEEHDQRWTLELQDDGYWTMIEGFRTIYDSL